MWYQYVCFERSLKLEPERGGNTTNPPEQIKQLGHAQQKLLSLLMGVSSLPLYHQEEVQHT